METTTLSAGNYPCLSKTCFLIDFVIEICVRRYAENVSYYAELEERHKELVGETVEVGLMFASKAFVQLLANPIVGPLTHK